MNEKNETKHIPWVEKYRPNTFESIVLDKNNMKMFQNMIKSNYFPNILLYGPPGTGKTTTIMNLVNTFQKQNDQVNKGLLIHLNASDERGIDIIRNQIYQFVHSKTLFTLGTKIVILDEVDYMTKNAQQALKNILRGVNGNIRFFLICNYITRIDESLQNEFVRLRFNKLPEVKINEFLKRICNAEQLTLEDETITSIQIFYRSDIRSMINYIQCNQNKSNGQPVVNNDVWRKFTSILLQKECFIEASFYLDNISSSYNTELRFLVKHYLSYIIRFRKEFVTIKFMKVVDFITHNQESDVQHMKMYMIFKLNDIFMTIDSKTK